MRYYQSMRHKSIMILLNFYPVKCFRLQPQLPGTSIKVDNFRNSYQRSRSIIKVMGVNPFINIRFTTKHPQTQII